METVTGHENLDITARTAAAIGTFDGVHIGHQKIIRTTVDAARSLGQPALLLTFDRLPRQVLAPREPVDALMDLGQKLALFEKMGLDYVCVLAFKAIAGLSPQEFCDSILLEKARASHLFIGANFRFGAGAAGDPAWLKEYGRGKLTVAEVPLEEAAGDVVSSTRIRNYLRTGEIDKIAPILGRNHALAGRVVRGAGRGAGLGFPTANLDFDSSLCLPGRGVYIGYIRHGAKRLPSVINCGVNPTFGADEMHCEAHILDSNIDLYEQQVEMELAARIRDEITFPSPEALSRQIADDVHQARQWFGNNS